MGVLDWLKKALGLAPPTRDVTRLAGEHADLDQVEEAVDLSGGPLRPGRRRKALRDRRLVPDRKRAAIPRKDRKRLFTREEAARLFARTLLTRNRAIRDLAPDEEQLARYGLPVWRTAADIADAIGVRERELVFFSIHREAERWSHYVTFAIEKRGGGERLIMAPKRRLKRAQRRLHEILVSKLPVSEHAHGFLPKRSIKSGAEPHVGKAVVVRLDIRDFFPTITFARVRGLLISLGYGYPVATTLAVLMTEAERRPVVIDGKKFLVPVGPRALPQGAPTSPGLANAIAIKLDRRLAGLARARGFSYTRYADDLTFSGDDPAAVKRLVPLTTRILREEGFELHTEKTRVARKGARQVVTGVVVNRVLGLSRQDRRKLRAAIHRQSEARKRGEGDAAEAKRIAGYLAYLAMLNPVQAAALRERL